MRALLLVALAACSYSPRSDMALDDPDGPIADAPMGDAPPLGDPVRALEIVDNQVTGGPHVDFPVLVKTTQGFLRDRGNGGEVTNADGFDIYFSADQAGTLRLAHEVERYDAQIGELIAWVKVPSLTAATVLYLHYGSDLAESQEDRAAVWSAGYVVVLHLDDASDATGNATTIDSQTIEELDTPIDRGQRFDGTTDRIIVGSPTIHNIFATGGTAQGWFFATSYGESGFGRIWDKGHTNGWSMAINNGNATNTLAFVHGDSISFGEWNGPSNAVSLGAWHQASVVYDKQSADNLPRMYIDGAPLQNIDVLVPAGGTLDDDTGNQLMAGNRGANDRTFEGILDELRMSNVARSSQWLATEFANQARPEDFYTISAPL